MPDWKHPCEFNPKEERSARDGEHHAAARWFIRSPHPWRLCNDCIKIPCFKHKKKVRFDSRRHPPSRFELTLFFDNDDRAPSLLLTEKGRRGKIILDFWSTFKPTCKATSGFSWKDKDWEIPEFAQKVLTALNQSGI